MQIQHTLQPNNGILASLNVENLFNNEPANETIDIIMNGIYNNPSLLLSKSTIIYFGKYS